jgi:hypothetical protein
MNKYNDFNKTINTDNHNNTIISIYNNYNFEKDNNNIIKRYEYSPKKKININIALDTLNNIYKEKNKNNYHSYDGYKIKLKNYKNSISLNPKEKANFSNKVSLNHTDNQASLNAKIINYRNLYNTKNITNTDYCAYNNDSCENMRKNPPYFYQDLNVIKLKQNNYNNKNINKSFSRPNVNGNSYKMKNILNEFNQKNKSKTILRNTTHNYMNFPNVSLKTEKECISMNNTRSKIVIYGANLMPDNKNRMIGNNYMLPYIKRKYIDVLNGENNNFKNSENMYDFKLMDKIKMNDSFFKKNIPQNREFFKFKTNRENDSNILLYKNL